MENIFESWGKRNPYWEKRYKPLIDSFCQYGTGTTSLSQEEGKTYGAGYELFIIAFFIGLYAGKEKPVDESSKQVFGNPINRWGVSEKNLRKPYSDLMRYVFVALIAKTDIDFIALDKGKIPVDDVVDALKGKMERFANYGFEYLSEHKDSLYGDMGFIIIFLDLCKPSDDEVAEPESLD